MYNLRKKEIDDEGMWKMKKIRREEKNKENKV